MIRQDIKDNLLNKFLDNSTELKEYQEALSNFNEFIEDLYIKHIPKEIMECFSKEPRSVKTRQEIGVEYYLKSKHPVESKTLEFLAKNKNSYPPLRVNFKEKLPLSGIPTYIPVTDELYKEVDEKAFDLVKKYDNYQKFYDEVDALLSMSFLSTELLTKKLPQLFIIKNDKGN